MKSVNEGSCSTPCYPLAPPFSPPTLTPQIWLGSGKHLSFQAQGVGWEAGVRGVLRFRSHWLCMPASLWLLTVDLLLILSYSLPPPLVLPVDRCSLPPFHFQSPGLSPSRLGYQGQSRGLLLVLTVPSWGQERNGQHAHSVSASPPTLDSSRLTKLTAARSSPGFTSWHALLTSAAVQALDD